MRKVFLLIGLSAILVLGSQPGFCARIKDIASLQGVRENQLVGYGLVIGLDGSGDSTRTGFTRQTVANMLQNMEISVNSDDVDVDNVATVMVTAKLPPFAKNGDTIDAVVSSVADADSLVGGTLLRTPLKGPQGTVYAVAQGSLATNSLAFGGEAASVQKNHPTVGRIPNGAIIEREVPYRLSKQGALTYNVKNADFTTISRITKKINKAFSSGTASAVDGSSFEVEVPKRFQDRRIQFISALEQLQVTPGSSAKVVVNERTGTIVMGQKVRISKVAVSHGNLKLKIRESPVVSQPPALSGGETREVPRTEMEVQEEEGGLMVMQEGVSIGDVASALNAIGATPRDLISIFQAIKAAGALHAELEIM
ncbi:MAG: flagellar basal body P-ring protein FlgI [Desulfohalobiaceae bacterium]|nr:flagellar basal body P-ring protein FlgI [Desulfohalobiaceae bacterium]MCF8086267.1 flagellar basal body P-ring protein FlgI [Desulfohalobiaceae bacterium]